MPASSLACPQCEGPREPKALYCPFCGLVFARYREQPPAEPAVGSAPVESAPVESDPLESHSVESQPVASPRVAAAAVTGDLYPGPAPPDLYPGPEPAEVDRPPGTPAAAPGAAQTTWRAAPRVPDREHGETPFTRNLLLSILAAGLLFALAQVFFADHVMGGSDDLQTVRSEYRRLTGLRPPDELDDAILFTFVGRHFLLLGDGLEDDGGGGEFPSFLLLYHHGLLAGDADGDSLRRAAQDKVRALGLPVYPLGTNTTELRGRPVPTETYGVGTRERPVGRLVYWTLSLPDGRPAVLILGGPGRRVVQLQREYSS